MKNFTVYISIFIIFILCALPLLAKGKEKTKPLSILIIGGGPAGLATAIEARESGSMVTLVEKRPSYTRNQGLFLIENSLKLLEKWKITIPQMTTLDIGEGNRIGLLPIKLLEEALENKALELGIHKIYGEFKNLTAHQTALILAPNGQELKLPYDILVAADGAHSRVRETLSIPMNCLDTAKGAVAFIPHDPSSSVEFDISPPIKQDDLFLRRFKAPYASIIFIQSPLDGSKNRLQKAVEKQGWHQETQSMCEDKAFIYCDIPIFLQQAQIFSHEKHSAILVGDAAATASFFQGKGANTALQTAEIAGQFFKAKQSHQKTAFQNFNLALKEATDVMIEDSAFLFSAKSS